MRSRNGLTLVDLLIAMTVLAVVLSAVYGVFAFQNKAVKAATEGRNISGQGMMILDRLTRDFTGLWLPAARTGSNENDYFYFEAGVDALELTTTSSLSQDILAGSEVVWVDYRIEPDPDGDLNKKILYRGQKDNPYAAEPSEIILTKDLISLEIKFISSMGEEKDRWDKVNIAAKLPKAVEIRLVLSTVEDREESFVTFVHIPMAMPQVKKIQMPEGFDTVL